MNDSFLEELELIPKESKETVHQVNRYITTRHATSSPLLHFSEQDERDNIMKTQKECSTIIVPSDIKITGNKESRDLKKQFDQNVKKYSIHTKPTEKLADNKGKPVDIKLKMGNNNQQVSNEEHKMKLQETRHVKIPENKTINKYRGRRSAPDKETVLSLDISVKEKRRSLDSSNNHSSDTSSKENSRPSDSSKEAGSYNSVKNKGRLPDKSRKSGFKMRDQDPVVLVTAIKELISTYTKQETTKILCAMQELHINSQAVLMKNLLDQTDDLVKVIYPCKDSNRMISLIEENERLKQKVIILQMQNELLQNKLEEVESLKQENAALKLKCNNLMQK